ncbi:hypothetical protein JZ751_008509 [Albula glossodonta]|uniref:Uncharacterized protein n=1 Tax=Albula glossodonta TaxID=121402 RepID=A0A8T2N6J9_9TELE|nr:hypothetical protein JZ751_008509 [Albula glossodonta]
MVVASAFGFERCEVLAVFASTVLAQLGALFILKERPKGRGQNTQLRACSQAHPKATKNNSEIEGRGQRHELPLAPDYPSTSRSALG